MVCAAKWQSTVGEILIDNDKVDVNIESICGDSVLHVAVKAWIDEGYCFKCYHNIDYEMICRLIKKLLSRRDFDVHIRNHDGKTGLI